LAPVVFFAFNRPNHTRKVFETIRDARPTRLLIVLDGPRPNIETDVPLCSQVLNIVSKVDWDCDVDYQISKVNLGIRNRFASGLQWVFSKVDEAIILEDDCVPSPAFFRFVSQMLTTYRRNPSVGIVSGFNPIGNYGDTLHSHVFGPVPHLWGWGTWKRVWNTYDQTASKWLTSEAKDIVKSALVSTPAYRFWNINFNLVSKNLSYSTWDYQVVFDQLLRSRLSVYPARNLISNIGFEYDANHTRDVSHPVATTERYDTDYQYLDTPPVNIDLGFWQKLSSTLYRTTLLEFWILRTLFLVKSENFHRFVFSIGLKVKIWNSGFKRILKRG
jgi:hypothetical protein